MAEKLTPEDFRESLTSHVAAKAEEIREKYGPSFAWNELQCLLSDRSFVRYPCEIVFEDAPLREEEFAHPVSLGDRPQDGFKMAVHPFFASRPEAVVALVLYQLVLVNYGDFAGPTDAETFGAGVLGMDRESYYTMICGLADELVPPAPSPAASHGCACGGVC